MINPRVTIIIPTFNRANLVSRAIKSALCQVEKCNVIVVDHGSTDNTETVVKSFGPAIEYVRLENDFGPVFSWIHGALSAKTEFVKLLYDDDVLAPAFISEALSLMSNEVGFVASNASILDLDTGELVTDSLFGSFTETGVFKCAGVRGAKISRLMISPSALLLRKQDLLDGLYLGSLPFSEFEHHGAGPDHYVKLLVMLRYRYFAIIKRPLVSFGTHQGSITAQASTDEKQEKNLSSVYDEVWIFYNQLRFLKFFRFTFKPSRIAVRAIESFVVKLSKMLLRLKNR